MARIKKQKKTSMGLIAILILVIIVVILISGFSSEPYCGNKKCETGETCTSCPQDCGSCQITTTTVITTTVKTTTTTLSECSIKSDCIWCGTDCVLNKPGLVCIAIAPPEGYSCECINGTCTKLPITTTTVKISDGCTDSDGGVKYDVKGTVSGYHLGKPFSQTDFCTGDLLTEYYCLTYYGHKDYNCAYAGKKCVDGVCI